MGMVPSSSRIDEISQKKVKSYSYWYVVYVRVDKASGGTFQTYKIVKLLGKDFNLHETIIQLNPLYTVDKYYFLITFFKRVGKDVYVEFHGHK